MTKALTSARNWRLAANPNPIRLAHGRPFRARNQLIGTQSRTAFASARTTNTCREHRQSRQQAATRAASSSPRRGRAEFSIDEEPVEHHIQLLLVASMIQMVSHGSVHGVGVLQPHRAHRRVLIDAATRRK